MDGEAVAEQALAAADAIIEFAAPCYGPRGGHKLVDADKPYLLPSAAAALCEAPTGHPGFDPYIALARRVQDHVGDQSTGAILLAAHLVRGSLRQAGHGPRARAAIRDGLRLARRQALAVLGSLAQTIDEPPLAGVAPLVKDPDRLIAGLHRLVDAGTLRLDDVHIVAEPDAETAWTDGLRIRPQHVHDGPRPGATVFHLAPWRIKPRSEAVSYRLSGHADHASAEQVLRRDARDKILRFRPGLVVSEGGLDEGLVEDLAARGWSVWTDAPKSACRRIDAATGSTRQRMRDLCSSDAGTADITPERRGGLIVSGPGPAWTLALPAATDVIARAVEEDAERLLRAYGAWCLDPRVVPGAGAWQGRIALDLRRAAAAAPGRTPLVIDACADAFDGLGDRLPREAGVADLYACVRHAVASAFDTAAAILRIDGQYVKRASATAALRGGTGPVGSPKGMPGDIPPLM